ncbi:hypothetical protein [Ornithobacterium rhinotracheale]|uniref:hypothetical protein n=1 Tax=Ornithobacterium rhinotracheale TaxID=28251 RepID=UPI00129D1F98|nr:hypothetical protein [Ornithobacterium rhinotracheale]MRI64453.1 hypothetical protein [Ornithobacterium rhinotracheale]MRJ09317.1 hypothetical protein [Ornithobacterium rhinotracheale]UOH77316.1 hypothetical protein MT996_08860 [Ornithobacterium rhinotracheale]UOH78760.1 hypothetical protein MT996_04625 [Ornithobacterium rhinotracheale]
MEPIFKENPQLDVVYKTSDGKYFYTENDAKNYASNLEDKKVKKLMRGNDTSKSILKVVSQILNNAVEDASETEEKPKTQNSELNEKIQELKTLELVKSNYNQMKSLVKYFDLKTEDQKAETYIKVLEEYKQKISQ